MRQNDRKKENTSPKVIIEFDIYAILILDLILSTRFVVIKWLPFTVFQNEDRTSRPTSESSSKELNLSSLLNQTWARPDLDVDLT